MKTKTNLDNPSRAALDAAERWRKLAEEDADKGRWRNIFTWSSYAEGAASYSPIPADVRLLSNLASEFFQLAVRVSGEQRNKEDAA